MLISRSDCNLMKRIENYLSKYIRNPFNTCLISSPPCQCGYWAFTIAQNEDFLCFSYLFICIEIRSKKGIQSMNVNGNVVGVWIERNAI